MYLTLAKLKTITVLNFALYELQSSFIVKGHVAYARNV